MVGNGDVLKGDLFSVFEKRIGTPHGIEPGGGQQTIVGCQVIREPQSIILPRLWEKDVGCKRLPTSSSHKNKKQNYYYYIRKSSMHFDFIIWMTTSFYILLEKCHSNKATYPVLFIYHVVAWTASIACCPNMRSSTMIMRQKSSNYLYAAIAETVSLFYKY